MAMRTSGRLSTALLERAIGGLDRLAKWRKAGVTVPKHLAVGMDGEDAAFFYLRRKGYIRLWRGAGRVARCPATLI
jgi:hypothetical protein